MPYQPNIPLATDRIKNSQADLLGNFQSNSTTFNVNHVDFNTPNDFGKHKWVTFPVQAVTPNPPFTATEMALWGQLFATTNKSELWVNKQTQAGSTNIPFTASTLSTTTPPGPSDGWTYLPSGLIIQWGYQKNVTPNGAATVTNFPRVFPNQCLTVVATANGNPATLDNAITVNVFNIVPASFSVMYYAHVNVTGAGANYIAIGY